MLLRYESQMSSLMLTTKSRWTLVNRPRGKKFLWILMIKLVANYMILSMLCPMVSIETDTLSKVQALALRAKANQEKEVEWVFNETHPEYPQKRWRPRVTEAKAQSTKIDKIPATQAPTKLADRTTPLVQSSEPITDSLASVGGASRPNQGAPKYTSVQIKGGQ